MTVQKGWIMERNRSQVTKYNEVCAS